MNEPNDLDKLFWGRARVEGTYSLLYFSKNTSTQKLLHALKYQNKPETGLVLGREIGLRIKALSIFNSIDVLIPVPIHAKKQFVRGYNQSEQLASGISQITSIPVNKKVIKKQKETVSQTNRNRFERWDNVFDNFLVKNAITQFRHIAIIDDVITTGATLESLIKAIHARRPELRISIISLALTK
jgi:ComF family protein